MKRKESKNPLENSDPVYELQMPEAWKHNLDEGRTKDGTGEEITMNMKQIEMRMEKIRKQIEQELY